jgi:PKD repeat protein
MLLLGSPATAAVAFDAVPTRGEVPLEVRFTDRSGPNPSDWRWDFEGDGTIDSTLQNPVHRYTSAGNYTVRLTARFHTDPDPDSGSGVSGSSTHEQVIVVLPPTPTPTPFLPPVVDFSVTPDHGPAALLVAFQGRIDDHGEGQVVRWTWDFGDGAPAAEGQSVDHLFTRPGEYRVRLTVVFEGPSSPVSDSRDTRVHVTVEHAITVDVARLEIEPVEEIARGDPLELTGSTSLAPGEDLLVEIVRASYRLVDIKQAGNVSGATGSTRVIGGGGTPNTFRFTADTSQFEPGTFTVTVQAVETDATATTTFALVERITDTPTTTLTTVTPTPTASPSVSPSTSTPTPSPVLTTLTTFVTITPTPTATGTAVPPTETSTRIHTTATAVMDPHGPDVGGGGEFPWLLAAVATLGLLAGGVGVTRLIRKSPVPDDHVPGLTIEPRGGLRRPHEHVPPRSEAEIEIEVRGGIHRER